MVWNVPNILTMARVILIPFFVLAFYLPVSWHHTLAAALFGLAALTDWFDGYLARRLSQTSPFGAFMDPVADKLMVAAALVMLVQSNPTVWFTLAAVIIIGREIAISALREWMAELGERGKVSVSVVGKFKTTAQMIAILLLLYHHPIGPIPVWEIGLVLLYVAAALTLWSMVVYLRAAWPMLSGREQGA
jgi:CDP-diacylglycerol--glycerol-3-phosphate 3-phosphatidyltransferase/cardiolipin synthase